MARFLNRRFLTAYLLCTLCFGLATRLTAQDASEEATTEATEKEEPKSSKAAMLLYAEAAGFQNNQQWDLAATEWSKFLESHAEDPRILDAQYNLAICQLQSKEFDQTVKNLKAVIDKADADFDRLEDAYLNLGWSQYSMALLNKPQFFADASTTFQQLLEKFPEGGFRDQALFFGGESLYLQSKLQEAATSYAMLVDELKDSELHSDAMYALGVTYEDMRKFKEAGEIFATFLKTYPNHDLITEVKMRNADTILQAGKFKEAAAIFGEVAATEGFRAIDHARYRQAFCIAQSGDFKEAAELFSDIATNMKESRYAPDAAIAAGRSFYRAKSMDEAIKWFEQIENSDSPHAPEAAHWHARILLDQDKPQEAREVVAAVMKAAEKHPFLVSLKLDDADALYEMEGSRKESVAAYLKIAKDHEGHNLAAKALYNAAYGAMEVGDFKNGLAYAEQFSKSHKTHALGAEVQKVLAECKLQLGDHDDAAKAYKELAANNDEDAARFEMRRGLSLFLKKNYADAIEVLAKVNAAATSPDEKAESAYWLGRCYAGKQQFDKATEAYKQSQAANPEWAQADEVLLNLAIAQRRNKQLDAALASVNKVIADHPDSKVLDQAYYRLAEFSYSSAKYPSAIKNYSKLISDWPKSRLVPFSLYGRGWSNLRSGDAAAGDKDFGALREQHPKHQLATQAIYAQGMAKHQAGDSKGAFEAVEAYFQTNPTGTNRSDALYLKGLCQVGLGDSKDAITTFEQLLKADDNYGSKDKVLYELAWAYKNNSMEEKSLATFNALATAAPKSPLTGEAHYHIGESLYNQQKYADAIKEYGAASTLAKSDDLREKASYKLGWAHYQTGDYDAALAAFDAQLAVNKTGNLANDAEFMRGESLFKAGKYRESLDAYKSAQQKPSANETMQVLTYLHAGQAAGQLKDWKTSSVWIGELQKRFPKSAYIPQANYEQGWALRNQGELDKALQFFNQVTADSRNELGARARFMAGEVLFEKKDYNAAILEFRRVMYGYGAEKANDKIKRWQAKAAFEAGRCASVLAGQEQNPQRRNQLIEGAKGFFQYVADKHGKSDEADAARQQLQRLQPGTPTGNRVSTREATPGF